jgi:hypothetical protein
MQRHRMLAAVAAIALVTLAPLPARAAELRTTLGSWGYHFKGDVVDNGTRYDFRDDLELEAHRRRSLAMEYDTPKGWWPDFAASFTQMGARGDHAETVTLPLPGTRTIATDADFDNYEIVARYPMRFGPLRVSAGVAIQQLKGELVIEDSEQAQPGRERYDETFPLPHVQVRLHSPVFALVTTAQGISYDGNRALEWRALVEARFLEPLQLEVGWQEKRYEIDLADYALDTRLSGVLVRVGLVYR